MKRLTAYGNKDNSLQATIYRADDGGEFVVQFRRNGIHQADADYFTDDIDDADGTAQHFVGSAPSVPVVRTLSSDEFAAIVGPLIKAGIHFDLRLPDGYTMVWLTWDGGDTVRVRFIDGTEVHVDAAANARAA